MILDIRTIPSGHSEASQTTDLTAYKEDLPAFSDPIVCEAAIDSSVQALFVHVQFKGTFQLECARCLTRFDYPFSGTLRLVIKEQSGKFGQALDDESADFFYDTRHMEVDLSPAIYEEIMTALPLKPLCSEDCEGIDLGAAGAEGNKTDPRWDALKNIRK